MKKQKCRPRDAKKAETLSLLQNTSFKPAGPCNSLHYSWQTSFTPVSVTEKRMCICAWLETRGHKSRKGSNVNEIQASLAEING